MGLLEAQVPVNNAIADAIIQATPEWWKRIRLIIVKTEVMAGQIRNIECELSSPDGHTEHVDHS